MKTIKNTPNHILPFGKMSAGQMGITLFLCFLTLTACKKDQPELTEFNKDCSCATEVSADFLMENVGNSTAFSYYVDTDSIYANRYVRFTAIEENANYTWHIGAEVLHERSFARYFNTTLIGQNIPISLKVEKSPNNICFPTDDGKDSVTRYLGIADAYNSYDFFHNPQPKWEGTFKMLEEGTTDSVDIKIYLGKGINTLGDTLYNYLIIENYNGVNDSLQFFPSVGYNVLNTENEAFGCMKNGFVKYFFRTKTYEIYLLKAKSQSCTYRKTYHFKGRKIN